MPQMMLSGSYAVPLEELETVRRVALRGAATAVRVPFAGARSGDTRCGETPTACRSRRRTSAEVGI